MTVHLTIARPRSAFVWPRIPSRRCHNPVHERAIAQRSPDAFGTVQRGDRCGIGHAVSLRRVEVRMHARMRPVPFGFHQLGADRFEHNIADGRHQMRVIHCDAPKPPLPEIPRSLFAGMNVSGISTVHL